MPLSKGAKIALGCGIAFVVVMGGIAIVVGGVAWWGVGKARQVAEKLEGDQKRTEAALKRANANHFSEPADGVIAEDRLVRFLDVRKQLYGTYEKHKGLIDAQAQKKDPDLAALAQLPGIILELRTAKAEALADHAMSEDEFRWFFGAVYRNLVAASLGKDGGSVSEVLGAGAREMAEQAARAAEAAEANPSVPEEAKEQLREAARNARESAKQAAEATKSLDVPPANMALFKKYEAEILRYTMGGLELLSL